MALLLCAAWDPVTRRQADVVEGNRLAAEGRLAEAEAYYRRALDALPGDPGVLLDLGTAHFRQAQATTGPDRATLLEAAEKEFRLAGDAPDVRLRASAHYSLGNTLFEEAKFKEAIDEYKKSLKLDSARVDARHNLELAMGRLPPPPPPKQQPGGDPKKPKDGEQQEPQQAQSGKNESDKPNEKKESGQGNEPRAAEPNGDGNGDQPKKDSEQRPQPQSGDEKHQDGSAQQANASDQDTERKLDALERRSKDLQIEKARERARERRRGRTVKDW